MRRRSVKSRLAVTLGALAFGLTSATARAQLSGIPVRSGAGGGGAASTIPSVGMPNPAALANPYVNPYANPFMNPYLMQGIQQPMTTGNAALYFFSAQQMSGGLGSGRLGGPKASQTLPVSARGAVASAPARDSGRSANAPGAGASRFFPIPRPVNPVDPKVNRYYNRQTGHFPNIGN